MRGMRGSSRFEQQRRKDTFSYSEDGLSPCPNQLCHLNGEMMHRIFLSCILRCTIYLHPRRCTCIPLMINKQDVERSCLLRSSLRELESLENPMSVC